MYAFENMGSEETLFTHKFKQRANNFFWMFKNDHKLRKHHNHISNSLYALCSPTSATTKTKRLHRVSVSLRVQLHDKDVLKTVTFFSFAFLRTDDNVVKTIPVHRKTTKNDVFFMPGQ